MEKIELSDVVNLIDQNADINGMVFHGKEFIRVVRCRECKHYWKNNPSDDVPVCLASPKDDAFCSEGERKEDAKIN